MAPTVTGRGAGIPGCDALFQDVATPRPRASRRAVGGGPDDSVDGMPAALPYGSWPSPIAAAAVASSAPRVEGARLVPDGEGGLEVWWGESVPSEGGRITVRRRDAAGVVHEVLPAPWNARSRVHEYGGGSWTTSGDGILYFVEKVDQGVWEAAPGAAPRLITPPGRHTRYGGLRWQHGRLLAVQETHEDARVSHAIVSVGTGAEPAVTELAGGGDFVAQPALSPDGSLLAWIAWDHPDMPWDRARLRVGRLEGDIVGSTRTIAGGSSAAVQPEWASDDVLLYGDDPTGRWNLWRARLGEDSVAAEPIAAADADTGGALWSLGARWYGVLADGRIVAVRTDGTDGVVLLDPAHDAVTTLALPLEANVLIEDVYGTHALISGAGPASPAALWLIDLDDPGAATIVAGGDLEWGPEWMPVPRAVTFEGPHGPVHAFDYPPTSPDAQGPEGELPPYLVLVHGGPTSHVSAAASGKIAYLTSRGIGVLDVNYGGSTGYGRAYRERLRGQWGVVDVDDVVAAATGLAATGGADPARLAIAGGSAGGWTVLCALTRSEVFAAGISRYGVADLRRLAEDTHDFEARYLDGLVGPLPEAESVYVERSPLSHLERLVTPMLIEQGLEDAVVPPSQSEAVRDALAARGVPHAYLAFEGEGHGFRNASTIVAQLEAEVAFLGEVLGFETPGIPPLPLS